MYKLIKTQPRNFENVTLVAREREHFWGFWVIFLVAQLPSKEVCWYTRVHSFQNFATIHLGL